METDNFIMLPTVDFCFAELMKNDKLGILDVHVLLADGTRMNMEMQVKYFECWDERVLFYMGRMFAGQIKKRRTI